MKKVPTQRCGWWSRPAWSCRSSSPCPPTGSQPRFLAMSTVAGHHVPLLHPDGVVHPEVVVVHREVTLHLAEHELCKEVFEQDAAGDPPPAPEPNVVESDPTAQS